MKKNKIILLGFVILLSLIPLVCATQDTMSGFSIELKDTDGNNIKTDHDLTIVVTGSDTNCTSDILFNETYSNGIYRGSGNITLGLFDSLETNYNQDYYLCYYVDEKRIFGVQKSKLGQGQISTEDMDRTKDYEFNSVNVTGNLNVTGSTFFHGVINAVKDNTYTFATRHIGDARWRLLVWNDGRLRWGDGTNSEDTNLYRDSPNNLKTDGNFTAKYLAGYLESSNLTGLPVCDGTDKLIFDGTDLSCSTDEVGSFSQDNTNIVFTNETYADPSWINSLSWSKLTDIQVLDDLTNVLFSNNTYTYPNDNKYYNATNFQDTNASTICSDAEVLLGNSSCMDLDTLADSDTTYSDLSEFTDSGNIYQNDLTTDDCTVGSYIQAVADDGTVTCAVDITGTSTGSGLNIANTFSTNEVSTNSISYVNARTYTLTPASSNNIILGWELELEVKSTNGWYVVNITNTDSNLNCYSANIYASSGVYTNITGTFPLSRFTTLDVASNSEKWAEGGALTEGETMRIGGKHAESDIAPLCQPMGGNTYDINVNYKSVGGDTAYLRHTNITIFYMDNGNWVNTLS